jgi:hypothetical protein
VGLAKLATDRLSPQILSPLALQQILVAINKQLPLGWTILRNDLWVFYREARWRFFIINSVFLLKSPFKSCLTL